MDTKSFLDSLNLVQQCRKYNLPLWQCPQFLFLILGLVVIVSSLMVYFIGARYSDSPEFVALIVLVTASLLIAVGFTVTHSFEKLAEVARLKTEFIGIVSHQLRSPLANLRWIVDLLISGKVELDDEKRLSYLQILRENSSRMEELISDLLVVSRVESGGFYFRKEPVSFKEMLEKVIERFSPLSQACNVEVRSTCPDDLPLVFVDPSYISLVLENLLDNAIRYIKGRGKVEVVVSRPKGTFLVEVKDDGLGVTADDKKYIFQKFFRGGNASRHQTQGSGLGLYIAKIIVEKSGGRIGFASQEGHGSTFWFTIK